MGFPRFICKELKHVSLVAGLLLGCLGAGWISASVWAQAEGVFVERSSVGLYEKLGVMEKQVYSRDYADQAISQRITRLEHTLFGNRQLGTLQTRYQRIVDKMNEKDQAEQLSSQQPLIEYLEQKLFEETFADMPMPSRLKRLENHVFGKTFEQYPLEIRIKKLTYTMPIMARGVRLSNQGTTVASTAKVSTRSADLSATAGTRQAPVNTPIYRTSMGTVVPTKRMTGEGMAISIGDYVLNIYRPLPDQVLRWKDLPVTVFVRHATPRQAELIEQALASWNRNFRFEQVTVSTEADVILDCHQGVASTHLPLTRPIVHLDGQKHIRTVVLSNLSPLMSLDESRILRAVMHQLGHAAGIWGHSDDPNDIMYPLGPQEQNDIPSAWLRRSPRPSHVADAYPPVDQPQVTRRDINTLVKLYDIPQFQDLQSYSPY